MVIKSLSLIFLRKSEGMFPLIKLLNKRDFIEGKIMGWEGRKEGKRERGWMGEEGNGRIGDGRGIAERIVV
jgi:hypothetical protein